ncbi:MAG: MBL fold metallo-hydrolase [Proteobacteria bacterium]|nr:MBL fold metallo-hydrolase [Pseudomonadota bacterium]
MRGRAWLLPALFTAACALAPTAEMMESCPGLVAARPPLLRFVAFRRALAADQVRITYAGHSTFLIESPKLVRIATDYNDFVKPPVLPDIVTMNRAHSTHYTEHPEAGIRHVLRGWREDGRPSGHDLSYQDVRVRSVATNIRGWDSAVTQRHGNSIFIFEIAQLCVAHLGHLHHTLNQQQLNEIGRVDIVFFPVDGGVTLDHEGMAEVLTALKAPLVIPMHYFSSYSLARMRSFMTQRNYAIEMNETPSFVVSKATLPAAPTMVVLPGR